jgi:uncharacterized protein YxjI
MSDQTTGHSAGWYTDPFGRFELRYYDGTTWTQHVSTGGAQSLDPFGTDEKMTTGIGDYLLSGDHADKFTFNRPQWEGTGHLFTEPVLVVKQRGGMVVTSSDFEIVGHDGTMLGSVRQVGQGQAQQVMRALSRLDKHMTHKFEVLDAAGNVMLRLTRPAKLMKSKIIIEDGSGSEIGRVVQEKAFGRIRFALEAGGGTVGHIQGTSWSDCDFTITDAAGQEIGRVTKSFEGLAKAMLRGSDNFVVAMHRPLDDPLRQLVIASGVCIDTALHGDDRGVL